MTIVSIPAGTPLVVEKKDALNTELIMISEELLVIVENTNISAIEILEKIYPEIKRITHIKLTAEFVKDSTFKIITIHRRAEKDEELKFEEKQTV